VAPAIAAMTATLFWVAGLLIAAVCGALAVREQLLLNEASERCQTAIQKMYVEYRAARRECGNSDCMPARPSQTCG
jgi:hypothetical protein